MVRNIPFALACLGLIGAWACSSAVVRITERDNGGTLSLRRGDVLTLVLRENPSTGYSWKVISPGTPCLEQDGAPTFKASSRLIGAGGWVTYRFRPLEAGDAVLRLVYLRPWEKGGRPANTFEITITVTR